MNENITSYLNKYIELDNPQYAIMLTGDWGCGKTQFVKKWKNEVEALKGKKYKPVYLSLFGINTLAELREKMNRLLHPFLTSSVMKTAKKIANGLSKTVIKCDFGEDPKTTEVSYELDLLSILESDDKGIKESGKLFIFDDIERCRIDKVGLLGLFNYFVEHCKCKVILVCNEDKMLVPNEKRRAVKERTGDGEEKWLIERTVGLIKDFDYQEFKEKTIGFSFEVRSNKNEAVSSFIEELGSDPAQLLFKMKPYVIQLLEQSKNVNLRILRQCFFDFKYIVDQIPEDNYKRDSYVPIMRKLLLDLIVVQYEIKQGNPLFDDLDNLPSSFLPGHRKNSFTTLVESYMDAYQSLNLKVLGYDDAQKMAKYIRTGIYPIRELVELIGKDAEGLKPWDKLMYFWNLSNKDFEENYLITAKKIKKRDVDSFEQLLDITFRLINFERLGIKNTSMTIEKDFIFCFDKFMSCVSSREEVLAFDQRLRAMVMSYQFNEPVAKWDGLVDYMFSKLKNMQGNFKSKMAILLDNLNSENINKIESIMLEAGKDGGEDYTSTPIFNQTDPKRVVSGICHLSNEERSLFQSVLGLHYRYLNTINYSEYNWYESEKDNVQIMVDMLKKKRLSKIDKYSVGIIIRSFEQLMNK